MTDSNHRPTPDILDQATEALRAAPVPAGPPAELAASTVGAITPRYQSAEPADVTRERRRKMRRYLRYGTLTATAAAVAVLAGVLWLGGGSAAAFHRAIDRAAEAKTLACKHVQKIGDREMPFNVFMREDALRMELLPPGQPGGQPVTAIVIDLKAGKGVQIDFGAKTVRVLGGDPKKAGAAFADPVEQFRKLKGKQAELVGEEKVNGRPAKVYRVKDAELLGMKLEGKDELRVWIDPKTELPVRVRADIRSGKVPQQFTWEDFRWDEKLDDKLFRLDPPEGFKLVDDPGRK